MIRKPIIAILSFTIICVSIIIYKRHEWNSDYIIKICTGDISGIYHPTGVNLKKLFEGLPEFSKYNFQVLVTAGSVENLNKIESGECHFAFIQSDKQYQAFYGEKDWQEKGAQKNLRSIFSLYHEILTLVVQKNSKIENIRHLRGKKVNLGGYGSGEIGSSHDILRAFNLDLKEMYPTYIRDEEIFYFIGNNDIDAFIYTIGHPVKNIVEARKRGIDFKILSIAGHEVDLLVQKFPYYAKYSVSKDVYPKDTDINSFESIGVKATFVTSKNAKKDLVYKMTKSLFENLEQFKKSHQAYYLMNKEKMLESLSAPIHQGALLYYKESGYMLSISPELIR